jgi:hypothetical protein
MRDQPVASCEAGTWEDALQLGIALRCVVMKNSYTVSRAHGFELADHAAAFVTAADQFLES